MGFRFFRDKTIIRRRNSLKLRRSVKKAKKYKWISPHRASSIISGLGWVKHTDSWKFNKRYIGGIISVKALRKIVSTHQKKINALNNTINISIQKGL